MPRKPTGRQRGRPPVDAVFTPAEERVLELLREGKNNAEIGVRLGISPDGAKYHISNMLSKTGLARRDQVARWQPRPAAGSVRASWAAIPLMAKLGGVAVAAAVVGGVVTVPLLRHASTDDWATGLVTRGYDGTEADDSSSSPVVSADGRYVVFV